MSMRRQKVKCLNDKKLRFIFLIIIGLMVLSTAFSLITVTDPSKGEEIKSSLAGTTYYIDPASGSDSNSGKNVSTPWRTIDKVNQQSLNPGDMILFKRGSTTSQQSTLKIAYSGTLANPIIIGAYGTGRKPILDFHGTSSATIYVRGSNITIRDIVANGSKQGIIMYDVDNGVYNIKILNFEAYNIGNGIIHGYGGGKITVKNFRADGVGNCGVGLMGSFNRKLSDCLIEDCWVANVSTNDAYTVHEGSSDPLQNAGSNFTLRNNHAEYCDEGGYDISTGNNILLINNTSRRNKGASLQIGHTVYDVTVTNHHSWEEGSASSTGATIVNSARDVKIMNSVFEGGNYTTILLYNSGHSLINNVTFENNFFGWGGRRAILLITDEVPDLTIRNNIFYSNYSTGCPINFLTSGHPPNHPTTTFENNIYYSKGSFGFCDIDDGEFNFSVFQSKYGQDKNGSLKDPILLNLPMRDFSLKSTSPAIDMGADVDHEVDVIRNPIYGRRDIGAFEYQPTLKIGSDRPEVGRSLRLYSDGKYRYLDEKTSNAISTFSMEPYSDWPSLKNDQKRDSLVDIDIQRWEKTGNYSMEFNIKFNGKPRDFKYSFSNLPNNVDFGVIVGGRTIDIIRSSQNGDLTFNYNASTSSLSVKVVRVGSYINIIDHSAPTTTTGGDFEFNFNIKNETGITEVWINYWYEGETDRTNITLTRTSGTSIDGTWKGFIRVRSDTIKDLVYTVGALNLKGNVELTQEIHTLVLDDDSPFLIEDRTPSSIGTGNDLKFEFDIFENVGVNTSKVVIQINHGPSSEIPLEVAGNSHSTVYQVPLDRTPVISYCLLITDTSGNIYEGQGRTVQVVDNDHPFLISDDTSESSTTGEPLDIIFQISDNIGLGSINLEIWQGMDISINRSIIPYNESTYIATVEVREDQIEDLRYRIVCSDLAGNKFVAPIKSVQIIDNDPPVFSLDQRTLNIRNGQINVSQIVTDNIGLMKVVLHHSFDGMASTSVQMESVDDHYYLCIPIPEDGFETFSYRMTAYDLSGNLQEMPVSIIDSSLYNDGTSDEPIDDTRRIDLSDSGTITIKGTKEIHYSVHSIGKLVSTALFLDDKVYTIREVNLELVELGGVFSDHFLIVAREIPEGIHTLKIKSIFSDGYSLSSEVLRINIVHPSSDRYISTFSLNVDMVSISIDETFTFIIQAFDQDDKEIEIGSLNLSITIDPDIGNIGSDLVFHPEKDGTANITFQVMFDGDTSSATARIIVEPIENPFEDGPDERFSGLFAGKYSNNIIFIISIFLAIILILLIILGFVLFKRREGSSDSSSEDEVETQITEDYPSEEGEIAYEMNTPAHPSEEVIFPEVSGPVQEQAEPIIDGDAERDLQSILDLLSEVDDIDGELSVQDPVLKP